MCVGRDLEKERKLRCARTSVTDTQTASLKCLHRRSQLHTFSVSAASNCPKFGRDVRRLAWMALARFWRIRLTGERVALARSLTHSRALSLCVYGTLP